MPEVLTRVDEPQAAQTPKEDLCRMALDHYDKIATKAGEWFSSIPKAVAQYYETDPEHQRLQSAVVSAAKVERDVWEAPLTRQWVFELQATQKSLRSAVDALIAFEAEHKIGEAK